MANEAAPDRATYQALTAVDEVAAARQTHLLEEHHADPERSSAPTTSTNSLKLLRPARGRLGEGLRTIEADTIAQSDEISLRREVTPTARGADSGMISGCSGWSFLLRPARTDGSRRFYREDLASRADDSRRPHVPEIVPALVNRSRELFVELCLVIGPVEPDLSALDVAPSQ
jgi:hypothetical protein